MESHVSHRERLWLYIFVGLVVFYLIAPTLIVIPVSFSSTTALSFPPPGWSLRWYEAFFGQEKWIGAAWVSVRVAMCTMILTTVVGTAASYALHQSSFRSSEIIRAMLISPLAVPSILIAVGIFFVYAAVGGMLNTLSGLVLGHCVVAMPFVILTMTAGFSSYDMSQEMVARSLGATRLKRIHDRDPAATEAFSGDLDAAVIPRLVRRTDHLDDGGFGAGLYPVAGDVLHAA